MKIITEPSIYIVGRQSVNDAALDAFLDAHGITWESDSEVAAEVLTETAGRTCYMSFAKPRPGGNAAYLGHIKEVGHGSVCEHAVWNFMITGVSRSLTHELVRHRAGMGYSQLSQRYVDESVAEYVCPDIIAGDPIAHDVWSNAIRHAHESYIALADWLTAKIEKSTRESNEGDHPWKCGQCFGIGKTVEPQTRQDMGPIMLMETHENCQHCGGSGWAQGAKTAIRKAARQAARSVLPNATETKIFVTANARAIRHFLEQRGSVHAEPEIRKLANKMLDLLVAESPNLFGDYVRTPLPDGTFSITTPYSKV